MRLFFGAHSRLVTPAVAVLVSACGRGPQFRFVQSAATLRAPKPPSCDFRVAATVPPDGYDELGVLEMMRPATVHS